MRDVNASYRKRHSQVVLTRLLAMLDVEIRIGTPRTSRSFKLHVGLPRLRRAVKS